MTFVSLASVVALILVHLFVTRLHILEQDRWRSVGAGVALSYVFLDVLPHLSSKQSALQDSVGAALLPFLTHHAYLLTLAGFVLYFCLAGVAMSLRVQKSKMSEQSKPHVAVYALVLALTAYCFLIGYLIAEQPDHRYEPVIIFAFAMAIHFAGVDHTVHDYYPGFYDQSIRYVFAAATFVGWLLGMVTAVSDSIFALVFSFVVGVIMVVALMYELAAVLAARKYWLFVSGVTGFSALLLLYEALAKVELSA